MGIQLQSEFFSDNGGSYDIYVYNESFAGSAADVITTGLTVTYESEGDPMLEPLKASRCTFSFVNDQNDIDTFITNLRNGAEDQFKMVVKKQNDLFWCGVVLVDQMSFEDMPKSRVIQLTAIDGIGRLSEIEFDYDATASESFLFWINECLEYNDLSQYWGASDAYFKESCEFYDTNMTNTGTQYSPLLQTRCDRTLFLTDEVIGDMSEEKIKRLFGGRNITLPDYRPLTCAEVLKSILQIMSCRMFISDGVYYIQQVRNFAASSYNERSIRKDLAVISYQTVNHRMTEATDVKRLGGGRWANLPPLKEVRLDSIPLATVATGGSAITSLTTATSPLIQEVELGTLKGGTGSGKTFAIQINLIGVSAKNNWGFYIDVELNFTAGSYRLKSDAATPDIVEWTTTATDRVNRTILRSDFSNDDWQKYLIIETPEFPSSTETLCELSVEYTANAFTSGTEIHVYPLEIVPKVDGDIIQESQFRVQNRKLSNQEQYSAVIDYGTPLLTDITQEFSSKNTFEINSTGSTWVFSGVWDAGYTSDVELIKTLCLETMSLQTNAVEVLQGRIKVPDSYIGGVPYVFLFWQSYYYDSKTYVFNGGTLDCRTDEFSGEWFEFTQDQATIYIQAEEGDGYVYRGDIKLGTPKKNAQDKDKWTRDYVLINEVATIDSDTSSGSITTISVASLAKDIKNGDTLAVLHPVNLRTVATVVVNGDQSASATSITVVETTPSEILYAGYLVVQKATDLIETGKTRTNSLVITDTNVPSTGGFGDGGLEMRIPGDGRIWFTDGTTTWYVIGNIEG